MSWSMGLAGQPEAAEGEGRAVQVQDLIVSILAMNGYTRLAGKAPRGKLAYKLNKLLKGQQMDVDDEEI